MSAAPRASRFVQNGRDAGENHRIRVSFEFFPPEDRGDGKDAVGFDHAVGAAAT